MAAPFILISGPCLIESEEMLDEVASYLSSRIDFSEVDLYLKGSFVKANRTSISSPTTIGHERALATLRDTADRYHVKSLTDVHTIADVALAAEYVDVLQIPAFLSRQTDLLVAVGQSGKGVNIKKGQFMAPEDMVYAVEKVRHGGGELVWVCERGTTFGYHDLVVDMRGLVRMREIGVPVIFDATHSTQQPSSGEVTGGDASLALPLARGAAAVGIDGIFFETHPAPFDALSDSATQIPLASSDEFFKQVLACHRLANEFQEK